ncbi:hypothetical protein VHEMI08010 [[Torrubiella] hemipterigena]|uniref:Siderophore iron transporter mirB n=1 Tax=[Torrubiella] hemipterigena TaxID=1531966 RepID=A0A0A1TMP8_9HYPO|nr:hypothetical protein VHEMI08010 [[Torrubiella] hemipterigena]
MGVLTEPQPQPQVEDQDFHYNEKKIPNVEDGATTSNYDSDEPIDRNAQAGVQKIEAAAQVWTKTTLILAFTFIWIVYFVDSMQQGTTGLLTGYVTSALGNVALSPTTSVLSNIIGGVFKLTIAKILDIFGRPQGYMFSVIVGTLGLVMMAACKNVEMYSAAQVFYWVGFNGIAYSMTVAVADMSSLRNRGLALAFSTSPFIITSFITGRVANAFLAGPGFRWAFGAFAIITPVITAPLFIIFVYNYHKAKKAGLVVKLPPAPPTEYSTFYYISRGDVFGTYRHLAAVSRTPGNILYYAREFDVIGLLLLSASISIFLLPFNIFSYQTEGWKAPIIIAFLVVGVVLMVLFICWEKYLAPVTFVPYALLADRTVIASCVLAACSFISYYCWDSYFSQFLQVVNGQDLINTGYILNIYNIGSCFWSFVVGLFIRYTGRFKPAVLYFGIPMTVLGVGLMIQFREPSYNVGYIVMCQIFVAFGGGTTVVGQEVAIMSRVKHQHVATVLAVQAMAASIGGGIGYSISAAIWQAVFPGRVRAYLPQQILNNATETALITTDLVTQLTYPVGSPGRIAIQQAYADAQRYMLIAGTCIWILPVIAVFLWHNVDVRTIKQTKGRVF